MLAPRKRKRVSGKIRELRKEHAEVIRERRKEALDAQALLAEHVKKRVKEEEAKNGEHRTFFSRQSRADDALLQA